MFCVSIKGMDNIQCSEEDSKKYILGLLRNGLFL